MYTVSEAVHETGSVYDAYLALTAAGVPCDVHQLGTDEERLEVPKFGDIAYDEGGTSQNRGWIIREDEGWQPIDSAELVESLEAIMSARR